MKRFYRAAAVAALLAGGLGSAGCAHKSGSCGAGGCGAGGGSGASCGDHYRNWWDVSWPDRYNYAARQSVVAPFAQQAANGHFLNQTIWNWYFEPGTDKLNPGGMEKLDSLARSTPAPDPRLYLQAAHDVAVTSENLDKVTALRNDLNGRRAAAIKRYMATQFGPPVEYEVFVHDAPVPGIYSLFAGNAYRGQTGGYRGGLSSGGAAISSVGGSASPPVPGAGTTVNVSQPPTGGGPVPGP